jgi:hypothetical protein
MPYTVYRPDGNTKDEFQTYVRLLRQSGVDLGKLPRMPDPVTGKDWLYVWSDRAKAEDFRTELVQQVADGQMWEVREVDAKPSEGPLGPLVVRFIRDRGQYVFSLDFLSRHVLRSAYPEAFGVPTLAMAESTFHELRDSRKDFFPTLLRTILPALTGLTTDQLRDIGYTVFDTDTKQVVYHSIPSALAAA